MSVYAMLESADDTFFDVFGHVHDQFTKLSFDVLGLRGKEKIFAAYSIPPNENLIAYQKSKIPFKKVAITGIMFTDKAMYLHPDANPDKIPSPIRYRDLNKYIITQIGTTGAVFLQNPTSRFMICSNTLLFDNILGTEIRQFLEAIQDYAYNLFPEDKRDFENVANWSFQHLLEKMRHSKLTPTEKDQLSALMRKEEFCEKAAYTLAEITYREGHKFHYEQKINTFEGKIPVQLFHSLRDIPQEFHERFINDLSALDFEFDQEYLMQLLENLSNEYNYIKDNKFYICIYAYVCIRSGNKTEMHRILNEIPTKFGDEVAVEIEAFRGVFQNRQMVQVFEAVRDDKDIADNWLNMSDSYGLTALHYALILGKNDTVENLLHRQAWTDDSNYFSDEIVSVAHEYSTVDMLKNKKLSSIIIAKTDELLNELGKQHCELKQLEEEYWQMFRDLGASISEAERNLSRAHRTANEDEISAMEEECQSLNEQQSELYSRMEELSERIEECDKLFDQRLREKRAQIKKASMNIKSSTNPYVKLLYQFYTEPDAVYHILNASQENTDFTLCYCSGAYFTLPKSTPFSFPGLDILIEDNHAKINSTQFKSSRILFKRKEHGQSWFSQSAHRDAAILKKEYRVLAKQLHPDTSSIPNCEEIFKEVSVEYSELMSQL